MCLLNSFFLAYLPQHKFMYVYIYGYTYNLCLLILIVCGGDVVSLCATLFMFDGVTTVRELFSPWLACLSCHTYTYMLAEFLCLQLGGEDHHDLAWIADVVRIYKISSHTGCAHVFHSAAKVSPVKSSQSYMFWCGTSIISAWWCFCHPQSLALSMCASECMIIAMTFVLIFKFAHSPHHECIWVSRRLHDSFNEEIHTAKRRNLQ